MAYDEGLTERMRAMLDDEPGVTEKKMFGGVCFLLGGNMFVGVVKADLMVRIGRSGHQDALRDPHARPMDFTGKAMTGYVFVAPRGTSEDADLARWIRLGRSFAATLPAKDGGAKSTALPRRRGTPRRGG
jgi:TfoX/Sxy family transcriptional regulator of competence genes